MTKSWKYAGAFAMILSLAAFAGAMSTLQQPKQQQDQIFEGALVAVDANAHVLTVKGADNKETRFTFTADTPVVGADNGVQGLTGKAGMRLKVHYKVQGESRMATRIEVSSS
jgi:hypothetical protein